MCSRVGYTQRRRRRHFQGSIECNIVLPRVWRHDTPTRTLRAFASSSPSAANWAICHQSVYPSPNTTMDIIKFFYALKGKCVKLTLRNSSYVGFVCRINPNKTLIFVDGKLKNKSICLVQSVRVSLAKLFVRHSHRLKRSSLNDLRRFSRFLTKVTSISVCFLSSCWRWL